MKTRSIPIILLLSALVAFAPAMTCRQGKAGVYQSLHAMQATTDAAITTYRTAVVQGKVKPERQAKIDAARTQYQEAFRLAVAVARNDLTQKPALDLQKLADTLIILISTE